MISNIRKYQLMSTLACHMDTVDEKRFKVELTIVDINIGRVN